MDVPIELSDKNITTTESKTVVIAGKTDPRATVTCDAPLIEEVRMAEDGSFTMTARLEQYGYNEISISAALPDGKRSTLLHRVMRQTTLSSYTSEAWALDYTYLLGHVESITGRVFVCEGTIESRVEHEQRNLYRFNAGTAAEPKMLIIEYNGSIELENGKKYRIYCDVNGFYDELPLLVGRYVYLQ